MQEVNAECDMLFKILKDRHENQQVNTDNKTQTSYNANMYDWENDKVLREILEKTINFSGIEIEIIGQWIWIFNSYSYRKELKELGFKYANNKKAWYFHTENFRKSSKKSLSINDIRNYYGSTRVVTKEMVLLAE